MKTHNCTVDVYRLTGNQDSKTQVLVYEDVRVLIVPATNEMIAIYGDMPNGGLQSFLFKNEVEGISPEDKLVVKNPHGVGAVAGDEYIVRGVTRDMTIMSQHLIEGVCVRV